MVYVWAAVLTLVNAGWLFLVVLGLPGTWLMVLSAALFAWAYWETAIGRWTLLTLVGLAVIGEVLEFVAGVAGSQRAGGTRRGAIGALAGGLIGGVVGTGAIPIPLIGSLLGACAGAFAGAMILELSGGRDANESFRSGVGAGVGRFFGTLGKFAAGVAIWIVATVAAFWP